jgi:hypothetical protein
MNPTLMSVAIAVRGARKLVEELVAPSSAVKEEVVQAGA